MRSAVNGPQHEIANYVSADGIGHASSRHLHQSLGFQYECVDIDGTFGSLTLDTNFDPVPTEHKGKFHLTTNHGTIEHVFNQLNAFKMIHDFTAPQGLMLHALPFTMHLEHGFFKYQPNVLDALARFNSYKTLGMWVGSDWTPSSLVPWEPRLLDYLKVSSNSTHLLVVLLQKQKDTEFTACPPSGRNSTYRPVQICGTGCLRCSTTARRSSNGRQNWLGGVSTGTKATEFNTAGHNKLQSAPSVPKKVAF